MQLREKYPGRFREELKLLWPRYSRMMDMPVEISKLARDREAGRVEIYNKTQELKSAASDAARGPIRRELSELIGRQVDLDCRIRTLRLEHLQKQVDGLKKELETLRGQRDAIVRRRLERLAGSGRKGN
jgi:hypothetical protein